MIPTNEKADLLKRIDFGQRIAEQEATELARYFVETDQWRQIFGGEIDVIYGPKGCGKSALYWSLAQRESELFDSGVLLVAAENPKGSPAFKGLVADPPAGEPEFVGLWKVYLLALTAETLRSYGIDNGPARQLIGAFENAKLLPREANLAGRLKAAFDYVRSLAKLESVESELKLDPVTGVPVGVSGKITLRAPSANQVAAGFQSVDELFELADKALSQARLRAWLMLDRLDVAFADSHELEANALRALFKVYLDLQSLDQIDLKIFLRDDIWRRITKSGFREASHIVRTTTLTWNKESLLNLIVRRLLKNEALANTLSVNPNEVLGDIDKQWDLFGLVFPPQVDAGEKKPTTMDWILTRTADSMSDFPAPREVIHLLSEARSEQLRRLERGNEDGLEGCLISNVALKDGLPEVSRVRYEQTLLAEHPELRGYFEALRGQRTRQTPASLQRLWSLDTIAKTEAEAERLVEVGFFRRDGEAAERSYWTPFLYRSGLEMVQGSMD